MSQERDKQKLYHLFWLSFRNYTGFHCNLHIEAVTKTCSFSRMVNIPTVSWWKSYKVLEKQMRSWMLQLFFKIYQNHNMFLCVSHISACILTCHSTSFQSKKCVHLIAIFNTGIDHHVSKTLLYTGREKGIFQMCAGRQSEASLKLKISFSSLHYWKLRRESLCVCLNWVG